MEYIQMTLTDWINIKNELEEELRGAAAGFVRIGYLLRKIDETQGYKQDGYDTLTEWAKNEYGLSSTAVSRFMAINKKYSIDGYSKQLRLEYAKYGQAKLAEMLTLPDEDLQMISPDMKREDIREIKAFERQAPSEEPAQEADIPEWIRIFLKMNDVDFEKKAFRENNLAAMIEEINPTGTKTFRHKRTMVSMFQDRIMVKEFPNPPERMEWREFFDLAFKTPEAHIAEASEQIPAENEHFDTESEHFATESGTKEPEMITPMPEAKPEKEPEKPPKGIAPAQKSAKDIVETNEKTDSAIAESEVEQVEIDEIMPAPTEPDPMRDLKDRFTAELNSLKVLLDCDNFGGMKQTIERLEQLRVKMATMKFTQS